MQGFLNYLHVKFSNQQYTVKQSKTKIWHITNITNVTYVTLHIVISHSVLKHIVISLQKSSLMLYSF